MSTSTALIAFCLSAETFPRHLAACLSSLDFPSKSVTYSLHLTPHRVFLSQTLSKQADPTGRESSGGTTDCQVLCTDQALEIMTCVGKPVWNHFLHQHTVCHPNKKEWILYVLAAFPVAVLLHFEISSAALCRSHIASRINNNWVQSFCTSLRLCLSFLLLWSKIAGMETMHFATKAWHGIKHFSLALWLVVFFFLLPLPLFPRQKKTTLLLFQ